MSLACVRGVETADGGDLLASMDEAAALVVSASAQALHAIAAFDERRLWERDGATSMTSWLAGRYAMTWGTARE
jgi:hypothetical protein